MDVTEKMLDGAGAGHLPELLSTMGGRELQTTLLETFALRAGNLAASDVLRQYETSEFTTMCELGQRDIIRFEGFAADTIPPKFDLVELPPVTALGSNSVFSNVSQRTVMATSRNTEVIADGVTALTLEAARRRRQNDGGPVENHLGTFHREMRTQQHVRPGFTTHFHALSLVSSEKVALPDEFKSRTFADHTATYLDIIQNAGVLGYEANNIEVALSNVRVMSLLVAAMGLDKETLLKNTRTPGFDAFKFCGVPLPSKVAPGDLEGTAESLPSHLHNIARPLAYMGRSFAETVDRIHTTYGSKVSVVFDLGRHAGMGYYQDLAVKITATNAEGNSYPLVDIGTNDWLAKLLNNKQERLITGGMGTELFMKKFRQTA
ncbi:MAG: hypothetical protein AAB834_08120 [Patescibacteria group bacterium]